MTGKMTTPNHQQFLCALTSNNSTFIVLCEPMCRHLLTATTAATVVITLILNMCCCCCSRSCHHHHIGGNNVSNNTFKRNMKNPNIVAITRVRNKILCVCERNWEFVLMLLTLCKSILDRYFIPTTFWKMVLFSVSGDKVKARNQHLGPPWWQS
jgi:hypothetical protein